MYTLYYSPGTASMVVHLALLEIGADYRLELVDFDKKAQHSAEYLKLNPCAKVPTLLIEGRPVYESAALLAILAACTFGDPADILFKELHCVGHGVLMDA